MPTILDLEFYAGDDKKLQFILRDDQGTLIDLTGWSASIQFRQGVGANIVILDKPAIIDGPAGELLFEFTGADTRQLLNNRVDFNSPFWDLDTKDTELKTSTFLRGRANVRGDITR